MKKIVLVRVVKNFNYILGRLYIYQGAKEIFNCATLELPYKDNKVNQSAIPPGSYPIKLEWSPRFSRLLWELKQVPGRTEIKIHNANYVHQLNGCIAVGREFLDINNDGVLDVVDSAATLERFHEKMLFQNKSNIIIIEI